MLPNKRCESEPTCYFCKVREGKSQNDAQQFFPHNKLILELKVQQYGLHFGRAIQCTNAGTADHIRKEVMLNAEKSKFISCLAQQILP